MKCDYRFFAKVVSETRRYRLQCAGYCERLEEEPLRSHVKVLDATSEKHIDIETKQLVNPPSNDVLEVNRALKIRLPADFTQFYKRWNGAYLLLREPYRLMPAKEILDFALELRRLREEPLDLPFHVVRFCDMRDGFYLALRRKPGKANKWEVIWGGADYLDAELATAGDDIVDVLDPSFCSWLKRMIRTDGWPISRTGKCVFDYQIPAAERIDGGKRLGKMRRKRT